jgi:Flp pilus assembly pilin Flp|tara:strand:- start:1002 stop:1178 length:177 start_codon:yes stop_codon:yes gene_type:complete
MLPFTRAQAQRGQGMTEYVIILVAIAIICIAITVQFGGKIKALFETADAEIDTVDSSL